MDFQWPCDLRIAHGPHPIRYYSLSTRKVKERECPGVRAHPNTMIGHPRTMIERKQPDA